MAEFIHLADDALNALAQQHVHDAGVFQPREDDDAQAGVALPDRLRAGRRVVAQPAQHRVLAYEHVIGRRVERLLHAARAARRTGDVDVGTLT